MENAEGKLVGVVSIRDVCAEIIARAKGGAGAGAAAPAGGKAASGST